VLAILGGGSWWVKRWFGRMERQMGERGEALREPR